MNSVEEHVTALPRLPRRTALEARPTWLIQSLPENQKQKYAQNADEEDRFYRSSKSFPSEATKFMVHITSEVAQGADHALGI
jgi:hypothetical protein